MTARSERRFHSVRPACHGRESIRATAYIGWTGLVRELVDRGADPNVQDSGGMTALAWAAKNDHGHRGIAAILLAIKADPTIASANGHTPLDWAIQFNNRLVAEQLRQALESRSADRAGK